MANTFKALHGIMNELLPAAGSDSIIYLRSHEVQQQQQKVAIKVKVSHLPFREYFSESSFPFTGPKCIAIKANFRY